MKRDKQRLVRPIGLALLAVVLGLFAGPVAAAGIDRLVARVDRRDDYGQLLAYGQAIHRLEDVDDVQAWRAEIKRQARADKIKVRTGFNDGIVWALRFRADQPGGQAEIRRYPDLLGARFASPSSFDTNRPSSSGTATR